MRCRAVTEVDLAISNPLTLFCRPDRRVSVTLPTITIMNGLVSTISSVLLVFLALFVATPSQSADPRPNIVFFFTDDQAYDTIGAFGNPDVKTPNLDRLANQGVMFMRHYNTTAICMASRANVMTGLLEYKHGCNFMHGPMARTTWERSYPMLLRKSGYRTAFGGKFGFAVVDDPREGGYDNDYQNLPVDDFDFWVGGLGQTEYETAKNKYLAKYADEYPHSTRAYGAAGIDFIRESVPTGKPFSLSIFFKAPHRPTTPDPIFDDVYAGTRFRKLPNYGRPAGEHLAPQHKMGRQYPRFVEWGYHTDETYQRALRTYHQQIHGVDHAVGMILRELEEQGIAHNTVIIFTSDNGFFNGSHGLGSKVLPYEEGARVPMMVYDPRSPGNGRRSSSVTGNIDIAATILDLAGVAAPGNLDGVSVMPIVRGERDSVRESLPIIQVWGTQGTFSLSVVTDHQKYVYWPYGEGMEPAFELFNLQNDPFEMTNVIGDADHASTLKRMETLYSTELDKWNSQAVSYNSYQPFGIILDRSIPWSEKQEVVPKQFPAGKLP
jgi:arylsulfatase A-like enzyme